MPYRVVNLHGGPKHGETQSIQADAKFFTVITPTEDLQKLLADPTRYGEGIMYRKGTYSQVHLQPTEFEWDGWEPSK